MADENRMNFYKQALEAAMGERRDVLDQMRVLEELQLRSDLLDETISNLRCLIGQCNGDHESASEPSLPLEEERGIPTLVVEEFELVQPVEREPKRFRQIEQILIERGRPMTFPEIVRDFNKRGWPFSSPQTLRNAVARKPKIFVKKGNKIGLVKWNLRVATN
jgi:hypothetical protein